MWQTYLQPTNLDETLALLERHAGEARIIAGGTDVLVELQRGVKPTTMLIDITAVSGLKYVREENGIICLGALATHNDALASSAVRSHALPLAQACEQVGAPQIRTRATIAGNLITASPANDTIAPLLALDAEVVLVSSQGERRLPLAQFYTGVRRTVIQPDEVLREIRFAALRENQRGIFLKLGLRQAQAISVINVAAVLTFSDDAQNRISDARVTLGSVAPTVIRARTVERYLIGKRLDTATHERAGELASEDASPIGDVRSSAVYRRETVKALVERALAYIATNAQEHQRHDAQRQPILLETPLPDKAQMAHPEFAGEIDTTINGKTHHVAAASHKTLLNLLREDARLTGTKEGCAEGECGACTVWLDGQAVMSCLVPAAQAHNHQVTTIEGLAATASDAPDELHPLQQAFIECGAVQCGFCIPGMLMAGAKLLDERPHPNFDEARIALSGNICRCTGYRKILDAVLAAGERENAHG
jgi:carbon-monoxide dehydrogenase medium subunit